MYEVWIPLCIEIPLQCGDESVDVDFAFAFDRGLLNDKREGRRGKKQRSNLNVFDARAEVTDSLKPNNKCHCIVILTILLFPNAAGFFYI